MESRILVRPGCTQSIARACRRPVLLSILLNRLRFWISIAIAFDWSTICVCLNNSDEAHVWGRKVNRRHIQQVGAAVYAGGFSSSFSVGFLADCNFKVHTATYCTRREVVCGLPVNPKQKKKRRQRLHLPNPPPGTHFGVNAICFSSSELKELSWTKVIMNYCGKSTWCERAIWNHWSISKNCKNTTTKLRRAKYSDDITKINTLGDRGFSRKI